LAPDVDPSDHLYGKISVGFYDGAQIVTYETPGGVIDNSGWHHVAATYDGDQYVIYVDGRRVGDSGTTFNGKRPPTNSSYEVGLNSSYTHGVDEVKFYQVALTAEQIEQIYGGGFNLINHLPFEDAPGSSAFANSANLGNDTNRHRYHHCYGHGHGDCHSQQYTVSISDVNADTFRHRNRIRTVDSNSNGDRCTHQQVRRRQRCHRLPYQHPRQLQCQPPLLRDHATAQR